jgi:hypothetical protein
MHFNKKKSVLENKKLIAKISYSTVCDVPRKRKCHLTSVRSTTVTDWIKTTMRAATSKQSTFKHIQLDQL